MIRSRLAVFVLLGCSVLLTGCNGMPIFDRLSARFNGTCCPPVSECCPPVAADCCPPAGIGGPYGGFPVHGFNGPILGAPPADLTALPPAGAHPIMPPVSGTPRLVPAPQAQVVPYTP